MARRKAHPKHENHERWLVSYADFITLLFAFFVVMFASSQADKGKAKQVSDSVRDALEGGKMSAVLASILGGAPGDKGKGNAQMKGPGGVNAFAPPLAARPSDLTVPQAGLNSALKAEIDLGELKITMEARGLVISLREAAFFPSGDDTILPSADPSLHKIASAIQKLPNAIRMEGHTDSIPIHTARFRSNWELSAARAIAMLELFMTRFQIPAERLCLGGYAETVPVESNDTPEGRAHNRRVDIVIVSPEGLAVEARGSTHPKN
jgi:chemotaxis protein MotB